MFVESYRYGPGEASYPVNIPGLAVNATKNPWDYPEQTTSKLFIMMAGLLILCGLAALLKFIVFLQCSIEHNCWLFPNFFKLGHFRKLEDMKQVISWMKCGKLGITHLLLCYFIVYLWLCIATAFYTGVNAYPRTYCFVLTVQ